MSASTSAWGGYITVLGVFLGARLARSGAQLVSIPVEPHIWTPAISRSGGGTHAAALHQAFEQEVTEATSRLAADPSVKPRLMRSEVRPGGAVQKLAALQDGDGFDFHQTDARDHEEPSIGSAPGNQAVAAERGQDLHMEDLKVGSDTLLQLRKAIAINFAQDTKLAEDTCQFAIQGGVPAFLPFKNGSSHFLEQILQNASAGSPMLCDGAFTGGDQNFSRAVPVNVFSLIASLCTLPIFKRHHISQADAALQIAYRMDFAGEDMQFPFDDICIDGPCKRHMNAMHMAVLQYDKYTLARLVRMPGAARALMAKDEHGNSPLDILREDISGSRHVIEMQQIINDAMLVPDPSPLPIAQQASKDSVQTPAKQEAADDLGSEQEASSQWQPGGWISRQTLPIGLLAEKRIPHGTPRVDLVDYADFSHSFSSGMQKLLHIWSQGRPILVRGLLDSGCRAMGTFDKDKLLSTFGQLRLNLGYPYSDRTYAEGPTCNMSRYLERYMDTTTSALNVTSPPVYTWGSMQEMSPRRLTKKIMKNATGVLGCVSEFLRAVGAPLSSREYSFAIGGSGSGGVFHVHTAAINIALVGHRRWFLYPPADAFWSSTPIFEWVRDIYPRLPASRRPYQFVQRAGDIVLIPNLWGHAVINVGDGLALTYSGIHGPLQRWQRTSEY